MILSHEQWMWFCSALTGGFAGAWVLVDLIRLRRALPRDAENRHDRVFGSLVGILIGIVGVTGVLLFHLG